MAEACADPMRRERGMVVELGHPKAGRMSTIGNPVKLWGAAPPAYRPAPLLGQHTEEVLLELGYTITGSDLKPSPTTDRLARRGMAVGEDEHAGGQVVARAASGIAQLVAQQRRAHCRGEGA